MQNIILSPISLDSLSLLIKQSVTDALALSTPVISLIERDPRNEKLSISELADYLQVTKATIHSYKKRGIFKYYRAGRTVYFLKSEVDAALAVNTKKGAGKHG